MKITKKQGHPAIAELSIVIEQKEMEPYTEKALQKLSKNAKMDGFRKGHVPKEILLKSIDPATLMTEALNIALPDILQNSLEQEELRPITQPKVDVTAADPLTLQVQVDLAPVIKIDGYEGVTIKAKSTTVKKADMDEARDRILQQHTTYNAVERGAQMKDKVEVNFQGKTPDGVALDGTDSKGHPLILGLNTFIPGFEDGIVGMKAGETKVLELQFPEDYHAEKFKGREVHFTVELLSVQEPQVPEIGPELALELFGKEMEKKEFEAEIKSILEANKKEEEQRRQEEALMEAWEKEAEVYLPPVMIEEENQRMTKEMEQRLQQMKISIADHAHMIGQTEEQVREDIWKRAEKRAKQRAILNAVIQKEDPQYTEEEVLTEMEKIGAVNPQEEEMARKQAQYTLQIGAVLKKFLPSFQEEGKDSKEKDGGAEK